MLAMESYTDAVDALLMSGEWRKAGLEFVHGARAWTARDLARWLLGPYSAATSRVPRPDCPRRFGSAADAAAVWEILERTHADIVAALRQAATSEMPELVATARHGGAIVPTPSGFWVPRDRARMLLRDRVLSLFAADYLLRPADYRRDLAVCTRCDAVVFDRAARDTGHCGAHRIRGFVEHARLSA
jgi:hypothetical protein